MNIIRPIDEALRDPQLLGAALGDAATWEVWLTVLRAASGLPLNQRQHKIFRSVAGNRSPPTHAVKELWAVISRRAGKSRIAAACAVHCALLQQHHLAPGEVGHVLVLSPSVAQARTVLNYCEGFIAASPVLQQEIDTVTQSEIRLRNGVVIGTHSNSFRNVRGRTLLACIFDESAFWRDEDSALPDLECYRAVLPALSTTGGMLIGISSPYRKSGLLYQKHHDYFASDDSDVLVVQGRSVDFNATLDPNMIDRASVDDPEAASSEWQGLFRSDIGAFLSDADVDACVDYDRPIELPPRPGIQYRAFCDPSGGRHDAMTLAVGHREGERIVVDVLRAAMPPFDPQEVVAEFAALLKEYRLRETVGDNYSGAWCETAFKAAGIRYTRCESPKGKLYTEGLPSFTRRTISISNIPKLIRELKLLERRTHIGGKDTVDHGRTGSDDHANAVFGLINCAGKAQQRLRMFTLAPPYAYGNLPVQREFDLKRGGFVPLPYQGGIVLHDVDQTGNVLRTRRVR